MEPTVKVVNWKKPVSGVAWSPFMTINEADYDPAKHKLYEDASSATVNGKTPPPPVKKGYDDSMSRSELLAYAEQTFGAKGKLNPRSNKTDILAELDVLTEAATKE